MRLDKLVADICGVTRSDAKAMIKARRVTVGGAPLCDCAQSVDSSLPLEIDSKPCAYEENIYIMLNKPSGCVCAQSDARHKTVMDILGDFYKRRRLSPVGRLDIDTTGLLILTNDGNASHHATSPKNNHEKTYLVTMSAPLGEDDAKRLEAGVDIGGYTTHAARVCQAGEQTIYLTITEGKFHQVKRMLEAVGNSVTALRRVSFCGIELDENLAEGEFRPLTAKEAALLTQTIQ